MGDLFCNSCQGISPRKLFAFFPNTCYLTRSGTKLCLCSSSQSCFNLPPSPHILCVFSSPWKAPPSRPVNHHVNPGLLFPVSALPARPRFLSPWPPALPAATAVCGAFVLRAGFVVPSSLFALWRAQHERGDSPLPVQQLWQGGQAALLPRRGRLRARRALHR